MPPHQASGGAERTAGACGAAELWGKGLGHLDVAQSERRTYSHRDVDRLLDFAVSPRVLDVCLTNYEVKLRLGPW